MPKKFKEQEDLKLTKEKWGETYKSVEEVNDKFSDSDYKYIKKYLKGNGFFLELGCGLAGNSFLLAKEGRKVVGVDICFDAVKLAKKRFQDRGLKGFFVCADMLKLPFKEGVFKTVFAGGSIEHFEDTRGALREISRVVASPGTFLATVPVVSLSQLTYGQMFGDIPDVFLLRSIAYFMHTKIFRKRFMIYGFQKSFPVGKIIRLFKAAGFINVEYGNYETEWEMKAFKSRIIKKILNKLCRLRLFWPFIYIKAEK